MKRLLVTSAIVGLVALPVMAQTKTETAQPGDENAMKLVVTDMNSDGKIDEQDLKMADTNGDGVVDAKDMPKMAEGMDSTKPMAGTDATKSADATKPMAGTDATKTDATKAADATKPAAGTDTAATPAPAPDAKAAAAATEAKQAQDITGQRVYDSKDEWIGEVSEMVVKDDKTWAIVDVGGFLGIGEKPVALDLSELHIVTDPDSKKVTKVTVDMTKDQLEALPTYEKK